MHYGFDEVYIMFSLMAKLEKADQAFCFTSGMAALAAVTHLLKAGKHLTYSCVPFLMLDI